MQARGYLNINREIKPEDWVETVEKKEIEPNKDKMMVLNGKKMY